MVSQRLRAAAASAAALLAALVIACGGVSRDEARKMMADADSRWPKFKASAVMEYRNAYPGATAEEKARALPRVVGFLAEKGQDADAVEWAGRGIKDGVKAAYEGELARAAYALAKHAAAEEEYGRAREEARREQESPPVTSAMYERVSTGMSYEQVVAITGRPGAELSRVEVAGHQTVIVAWQNPGGSNMNVTFQNGRAAGKAQFGLPPERPRKALPPAPGPRPPSLADVRKRLAG